MTSQQTRFGKIFAALVLAFVFTVAGLTPGHSVAGAIGHEATATSSVPCAKAATHERHVETEQASDFDTGKALGDCCDGTFCAGDTVRVTDMLLSAVVYDVAFLEVATDILKRVDLSLPQRPPQTL